MRARPSRSGSPETRLHPRLGIRPLVPVADALPTERLLALYRPDLSKTLETQNLPAYRHRQVFEHLMRPGVRPFAEATALPVEIRDSLDAIGASTLRIVARREAKDGTVKLLLACDDDVTVETVVMPYEKRTTACISTQAGCPVGCLFCATGAVGFHRNLAAAEIVDQVRIATAVAADKGHRVSNVVYMGMGEPLLNLEAVLSSVKILTSPSGLGLGRRSLSLSTVGIPAGIARLARTEPQVNLALSLHAPSDRVRESLIPARHRHPLADILGAAWQHFAVTRRKLMVEYVLLRDVNDSEEDARVLAKLLRGHVVTVNLLSWNPVLPDITARSPGSGPRGHRRASPVLLPSPPDTVKAFRDTLRNAGIEATIRESRGADIEAACGQLAGRSRDYPST